MKAVGKVVGPDGKAVPFASVAYFAPNATTNSGGTAADENGRFNLEVPNTGSLRFSSVGFSPKTHDIGNLPFVVILNERDNTLGVAEVIAPSGGKKIPWIILGPAIALVVLLVIKKSKK
jgi:hypothetical protein